MASLAPEGQGWASAESSGTPWPLGSVLPLLLEKRRHIQQRQGCLEMGGGQGEGQGWLGRTPHLWGLGWIFLRSRGVAHDRLHSWVGW